LTKNRGPHTFLLQGSGGTGKTFLYRGLCHHFRSQRRIVLCVAWCCREEYTAADLLRQTSLIIWDEVSMQHKHCFEAVHRMLTDVRGDESMFGGIPTVFGGDFAQIRMDL